jgi:starch-binding outer membrane protein SusE/F
MKTTLRLISFVILICSAWSCSKNENLDPVGNWELSKPTLSSPTDNASLVLNENLPTAPQTFKWDAAVATNKFVVTYSFVLVPATSEDYENPILRVIPGNGGKDLSVAPTSKQIDYALSVACFPAGAVAKLKWVIIASAIDKKSIATQNVNITRFATEGIPLALYITGAATEAGANVASAVVMRGQKDASGKLTGVFDVYTTLTKGATYAFRDEAKAESRLIGGSEGKLKCGEMITAAETAQYRVTVDVNKNTYSLLKIEKWSLVGDAIEGGWGGDVPIAYKGNGVWESKIEFYQPSDGASCIFRANGDWGIVLKRIKGSAAANNKGGKIFMESEASDAGITVENIAGTKGLHTVTLNLTADGYTYSLTPDTTPAAAVIGKTANPAGDVVSGSYNISTSQGPTQLFLVSDGVSIAEIKKDGTVYKSGKYLALQKSKTYILNSAADGTGTTFSNGGDGKISVDHDQAYQLEVDFQAGTVSWKHYNLKLFHWDDNGGWDARQELVMTYAHPYKFAVSGDLKAGFVSKFNSPWDIQFGSDGTTLTGTMTNGGKNFAGIIQSGTYNASIVVSTDFATADYSFVKQ